MFQLQWNYSQKMSHERDEEKSKMSDTKKNLGSEIEKEKHWGQIATMRHHLWREPKTRNTDENKQIFFFFAVVVRPISKVKWNHKCQTNVIHLPMGIPTPAVNKISASVTWTCKRHLEIFTRVLRNYASKRFDRKGQFVGWRKINRSL